jgi:carbon storage regulator
MADRQNHPLLSESLQRIATSPGRLSSASVPGRSRRVPDGGRAMLVIPRRQGESVVIDDDIIVTVIEVREDKVRLGIEIPIGGTVHRQEVYEVIVGTKHARDAERPSHPGPADDH